MTLVLGYCCSYIIENSFMYVRIYLLLTLKAPITTAADDKFFNIFPNFRKKEGMIFHENCLPADNSHEISCLL